MATTAQTKPTNGTAMISMRKTALVAGVLYLITFISSIPALFLLDPVLSNPDYILGAGADTQVTFGAFLDLINALACIGTAVALYSVVKRQHEGLALGFVTTRIFEAAVVVIGVLSILSVVTLRQAGAADGNAESLMPVAQGLVAVRDWSFVIGPLMPGINALLLGTLMYRSGLVPRFIPLMGLIGAPVWLSAQIGIIFGINETATVWSAIGVAPIFLWELIIGLWMTFKGFRRSSALMAEAAAEDASAGRAATDPLALNAVSAQPGAA